MEERKMNKGFNDLYGNEAQNRDYIFNKLKDNKKISELKCFVGKELPVPYKNIYIPVKSSKKHPLTKREKAYNKRLAKRRVVIEHINAKIKVFRCMSYPYCGHCCNRHSLRMNLICGIINYDRLV
jgi:hypothetical protein